MARLTIIHKRNAVSRRLLDKRVDALRKDLRYRLSESDKEKRKILRGCFPGVYCDQCLAILSAQSSHKDAMEHRKYGLRLQHSFDEGGVSEKLTQKVKPERSHSDNNMKLNYPDIIQATNRGHTTLADLKLSHGFKRGLHGFPCSSGQSCASSSGEFKPGSLALHHSHGDLYSNKLRHSSEMFHQSSAKIVDSNEITANDTNLTAFLFSRHCRHGYVMKRTTDPTEQANHNVKSKIRAKVVKNYLLQDVFKRLNSTKALLVRNSVGDGGTGKQAGLTSETIQTLERCRYLRLPVKKAAQNAEDHEREDDKLPKIDIN